MSKQVRFSELASAPLVIDATYEGGTIGNTGDDPLGKLLRVGNQGGFRYLGSPASRSLKYLVLYSNLADPDWPDLLDEVTGEFHYYGDNKKPGHDLHDTQRQGNVILRDMFMDAHEGHRSRVPPIFIFSKGSKGRDVVFRGLAVPGAVSLNPNEDLIAIWKSKEGQRFQNYKATFTILDVAEISRTWVNDIENGQSMSVHAPAAYKRWIETGKVIPLMAEPTIEYRNKEQQLPTSENELGIINTIYKYFKPDPFRFEHCSAELIRLMDHNVTSVELTRPWVDGGRDVLGKYRIGSRGSNIEVDFALEAKCYELNSGLGVKSTSRLISRIRHRQFGVFMTTSFVQTQAYKEIIEDRHPVIVMAATDIVEVLKRHEHNNPEKVGAWLRANFD
jgi:hypothetical protein